MAIAKVPKSNDFDAPTVNQNTRLWTKCYEYGRCLKVIQKQCQADYVEHNEVWRRASRIHCCLIDFVYFDIKNVCSINDRFILDQCMDMCRPLGGLDSSVSSVPISRKTRCSLLSL